jgi:hypothetical protein
MSPQVDMKDDDANYSSGWLPAPNFVPSSSGVRSNPPSLSCEMLLCNALVTCVATPWIPGCGLNNVDSSTVAHMHCPMYGVEHFLNE